MLPWKRLLLFGSFATVVGLPALRAQSYPVAGITFSGAPGFVSTELLAASGLKPGISLDQAGMQAAAQRLDATGMFATIKFSFNGKELHYDLTPAADLTPARFVNFPWWEAKEIVAKLTATVPLFHGQATHASETQQKIIDALIAMLAAKQITATVAASPSIDPATGRAKWLDFRMTAPPVQIGAVTFSGANGEWVARLAEISKAASGQDYSTLETPVTLTQAVEGIYRGKGYLDVSVKSVEQQSVVVDATGPTPVVLVPFAVTFVEGSQYRLGGFTLAGSVLMDQAEFLSRALLKPGDVIDQDKLKRTMQMISGPYVTRGYLRARISAAPATHPEKGTVDYAITVNAGDVYRMGKLDVRYLDAARTELVLKAWKMEPGAAYDASYVAQFLKKNAKELHPLDGYSASYKQYEHEDTHVVDLVVTFRQGGP